MIKNGLNQGIILNGSTISEPGCRYVRVPRPGAETNPCRYLFENPCKYCSRFSKIPVKESAALDRFGNSKSMTAAVVVTPDVFGADDS